MEISYALSEVIPIMQLLKDLKYAWFLVASTIPKVTCKVFKDNSGAEEIATVHKHRARTKHINMKTHHFIDYVTHVELTILLIGTLNQLPDYLTKISQPEHARETSLHYARLEVSTGTS